jgi:hypothetical protein
VTAPFALRPYTDEDNDFVVYSWLKSYAHSAYGISRGAHEDRSPEELAYWAEQKPVVEALLRGCSVVVACDVGAPHVIWGWACTSDDVVHYVLCKRKVHDVDGLSAQVYRALLGDRLERAVPMTHELVDFRRAGLRAGGVMLPRSWFLDSTWFARNMRRAA